jgi:hypothetical protein
MTACRFNGIVDAQPSGSSRADYIALHARLRNQIFESRAQIAIVVQLPCLFFATAFAVAALIIVSVLIPAAASWRARRPRMCVCGCSDGRARRRRLLRSGEKAGLLGSVPS